MPGRIVRRVPGRGGGLRDVPPLLARIYAARSVTSPDELDYALARLLPVDGLAGIDAAVDLLAGALQHQWRVLIVGDFDADGATSSALMVRGLGLFGLRDVDFLVPNRFRYGYGLTPEIVTVAAARAPDLIITVDNGISSVDGVAAARARGIRVLVTDHHLPGEVLPDADAIVNPNQAGDGFPSKHLAGVGVAFYVLAALRAHLRERDWFAAGGRPEAPLADLLDLVALGTVADVVPLDHNNRILVAQGLARIRAGRCVPGIRALIDAAGRSQRDLVSSDLAFALGPRLNAAGRLDDMSLGIACLLTDDPAEARDLALRLDRLNRERRSVEADMQADALQLLAALDLEHGQDALPWGLCLYDAAWHEGVIGILASRIKERLHRPVIGFAPAASQPGQLKGSARSIPGLHIRDVLDAVAARHPGLILKFGGHAAAAGLSLESGRLDAFRAAFDAEVRRHLAPEQLQGCILSDGVLQETEITLDSAEVLRRAGPWGQAFPEPIFDGDFELVSRRIVGGSHLKMEVRGPGSQQVFDAIAFNHTDADWDGSPAQVRLAYRLDVNEYRGRRSVQLMVEHLEPLPAG